MLREVMGRKAHSSRSYIFETVKLEGREKLQPVIAEVKLRFKLVSCI